MTHHGLRGLGTVVVDETIWHVQGIALADGKVVVRACTDLASDPTGSTQMVLFGPDGVQVAAFPNTLTVHGPAATREHPLHACMDLPLAFSHVNGLPQAVRP